MFGEDDPVPPPHPQFFSSDFGNSHDLAGLGLEARPHSGYVATATSLSLAITVRPIISMSTRPIDIRQISWVGRTMVTGDQSETSFRSLQKYPIHRWPGPRTEWPRTTVVEQCPRLIVKF